MCYHKSQAKKLEELAAHYAASYEQELADQYQPRFHENGFDFHPSPIVTAGSPDKLSLFNWGFVPFWVKDQASGLKLRTQTLNCISEEMYEKASFKDAAKNNQRCLIPCTGFYEWRWIDEKGKVKIPYYIGLKDQPLFSLAGLYSTWTDRSTGHTMQTYSVLTTTANPLMSTIHNSKKRMPVIIPKEFEKDWLNVNLTRDDVMAFCQPINDSEMSAYTISKLITKKGADTNVPEVMKQEQYQELNQQSSLF